jgi:hypothetical protein
MSLSRKSYVARNLLVHYMYMIRGRTNSFLTEILREGPPPPPPASLCGAWAKSSTC